MPKTGSSGTPAWRYPTRQRFKRLIEHTIISQRNYAYVVIKQSPDMEAFLSASRIFVNDPDFSPGLNRLCDFSQADLNHATMTDLLAYAKFAKANIPLAAEARVALVSPGDAKLGLLKSFVSMIPEGKFRVFQDPADAVAWIKEASVVPASAGTS
jgi:hypothetical protein